MKDTIAVWKRRALAQAEQFKQAAAAAFDAADEKGGDLRDELKAAWSKRSASLEAIRVKAEANPLVGRAVALRDRLMRRDRVADATVESSGVQVVAQAAAANTPRMDDALPPLGNEALAAQVYGRVSCPWTQRARDLLENRGVQAAYVDLTEDEAALTKARLEADTKQYTVPYVFLRGEFIGGYNALAEIERLGQLELRTMTAAEREAAPAHYKRVQVVERVNSIETAPGEMEEPNVLE